MLVDSPSPTEKLKKRQGLQELRLHHRPLQSWANQGEGRLQVCSFSLGFIYPVLLEFALTQYMFNMFSRTWMFYGSLKHQHALFTNMCISWSWQSAMTHVNTCKASWYEILDGGFEHFCIFPYVGNSNPKWLLYFSEGWKPSTRLGLL